MPEIQLSEYYVELIGFLLTLLIGLAIKDWATSLVKGLNFKYNSSLKEGDKVILDDDQAMIIKIGTTQTVFGVYSDDGYTWRFIPNERIPYIKIAKVVDSELHQDSKEEKAQKIKELLEGDKDG
tara:strand:+ start:638 stop:1009 length:372 start_codon:yes stop_codon:yes gene_type:complete